MKEGKSERKNDLRIGKMLILLKIILIEDRFKFTRQILDLNSLRYRLP